MSRKLLCLAAVVVFSIQPEIPAEAKTVKIQRKTYAFKKLKNGEKLLADVYRPEDDSVRPVVVWIHGGALIVGDRKLSHEPGSLLHDLLKAGYVVVSIDYRLAPKVKLPAILEDVQDACAWVRTKGPKLFHIDPKKMAVMGGSAGGYLTLMTGFRVKPRPTALVSLWGYGDIDGDWYSKPDPFYRKKPLVSKENADKKGGGTLYLYLRQQGLWPKKLTGHDPATEPRAFDPLCPIRNITKNYPPTLLIHGDKDTDVPYQQSEAMARELKRKKVSHRLVRVVGGGHGLGNVGRKTVADAHAQVVAFLNKYMK
jgi:acetyl esterase/lipase